MKLSHLALTVIEDPDRPDLYRWILLEATGQETEQVRESEISEVSFESALAAFDAGALRWRAAMASEDEDADPVGGGGIESDLDPA
jgi:hypothetical protein